MPAPEGLDRMTHAEDIARVHREQRLKRALLLAREAQKQLDALSKPLPSNEEASARKRLVDCRAVEKSDEEE